MVDIYLKYISIKLIVIITTFLIDKSSALSICPTAVWATKGTTVAGSQNGYSGSILNRLIQPTIVIVDNSSNIYVADGGNFRILLFPPGSTQSTSGTLIINGSSGTELDQFGTMDGMSIDTNGNIYILDGTLSRVTKWTPGSTSGILVAGGAPFVDYYDGHMDNISGPGGIFMAPESSFIWIADTNNSRIVKYVNSSTALTVCGSYGTNPDQFNYPLGLFIDTTAGNTLYVVDSGNHRIQRWLSGATSGTTVAGITSYYGDRLDQLWDPTAILVDNNQNMYIVDSSNSRILKWKVGASSGMIIAGNEPFGGQTSSQLWYPNSISFSSNGTLYVADTENNRTQRFSISCPTNISTTTVSSVTTTIPISTTNCSMTIWAENATTIAGSPIGIAGLTSTLLSYPMDVRVDANDSIYVIDYDAYYRLQIFYPGSLSGITIINASFGTDLNQFSSMDALYIDMSGNFYILDSDNSRITKWGPGASTGILVAGGNGIGSSLDKVDGPTDFFVEPNTSSIWICDSNNHRIVKWMNASTGELSARGNGQGTKANQFDTPLGLFVDTSASNTLYVADTNNCRIQQWLYGASSGKTVAGKSSGTCGSTLNLLSYPDALIMDTNGTMYIVDNGNSRIVLWLLGATSGRVIAGTGIAGVLPDQLNDPYTVRLDSTGAVIVTDTDNSRIQKFPVVCSPNMIISSTASTSSLSSSITTTTSIDFTLQNTTMTDSSTTSSLSTPANNSTTILSASTPIADSSTVSTTVLMSTMITTLQANSLTNTTTQLSSGMDSDSESSDNSAPALNLNSKLFALLFCAFMIYINN
ncbi:unnamed protein product [Adineta steineri]|uniref:NHL repeat containing protein-like protein n=1 Tax=Adineta steineri TaxID=433720 RepID=A0A815JH96_9BILA|nr:unnamed protein product [Adineta steineri]CAF1379382.1 unnamed protein product [Adineta steineri]